MPKSVEGLTEMQTQRIYRDFLIGRPRAELQKKYDISEETFWEIVGLYRKRKHINDVGNAKDILGPTDPLVTRLDTGSGVTEHAIVARNPRESREVTDEKLEKITETAESQAEAITKSSIEEAKSAAPTASVVPNATAVAENMAARQRAARVEKAFKKDDDKENK